MDQEIIDCGKLLIDKNLTIAFAESATAGYLSSQFSLVQKAGQFLKGGLACYDADLKKSLLGVSEGLIEAFTPESAEVTNAMCHGLTQLIPADIHVAVTGLTCPGGSETPEKPVGTIFLVGMIRGQKLFSKRIYLQGDEQQIIRDTAKEVALLISNALQ
jgi:nicotinamide-nucleotide amidase